MGSLDQRGVHWICRIGRVYGVTRPERCLLTDTAPVSIPTDSLLVSGLKDIQEQEAGGKMEKENSLSIRPCVSVYSKHCSSVKCDGKDSQREGETCSKGLRSDSNPGHCGKAWNAHLSGDTIFW